MFYHGNQFFYFISDDKVDWIIIIYPNKMKEIVQYKVHHESYAPL